jgi:hypothetical protein
MGEVVTIGLDIAKSVFQVHGVDSAGAEDLYDKGGEGCVPGSLKLAPVQTTLPAFHSQSAAK